LAFLEGTRFGRGGLCGAPADGRPPADGPPAELQLLPPLLPGPPAPPFS